MISPLLSIKKVKNSSLTRVLIGMYLSMNVGTVSTATTRGSSSDPAVAARDNRSMIYTLKSNVPALVDFRSSGTMRSQDPAVLLKETVKAREADDARPVSRAKDELDITTSRYQQFYKNIKVEGGEYIVHAKNDVIQSMNGLWIDNITLNTNPSITEAAALAKALQYTGAQKYKWQVYAEEQALKKLKNDPKASYYPKGELVIASKKLDYKHRDLRLCYKFDVYAQQPESRKCLYVDASSGEVIAELNRICSVSSTGSAVTRYSGTQPIITDSLASNSFRLYDNTRGKGIETLNLQTSSDFSTAISITNTTNFWNTSANYDNAAYDAHWGMEATYDYYLLKHSRNSLDNAGLKITGYVHYAVAYADANWDGTKIRFGDGNNVAGGVKPVVALDIVGHELTHGVIDYTCNLITANESGALNESFADIMGTNVEWWKKPGSANWLIGSEIFVNAGGAVRNMANPNAFSQPDTYKGTYWDSTGADLGGVHKNNGVNNYWYYLVCNGGSGNNDKGNAFNVAGIGISKAEKIVYRMLKNYLTAYSEYADARIAAIEAATDLYGACSAEVQSVTKAWYAVGVGANYSGNVSVSFTANATSACSSPLNVTFTNATVNATSVKWYFGDGGSSSAWDTSHVYANAGVYSVKLVASGACGADSVSKNSLINISLPAAPSVTGNSRCGAGTVNLSASGSGMLKWYSAASGGTLVNTGNTYSPSVASTTTYYVQDYIPGTSAHMGPVDQTFGANGVYGNVFPAYMVFDVYKRSILRTVNVVSTKACTRKIDLIDGSGLLVHRFTITLDTGSYAIPFNYLIEPGSGYHLGGDSMFFTFTGKNVSYPYTLAGVASITKSTLDIGNIHRYLFFYNWDIETDTCRSPRVAVVASIEQVPAKDIIKGPSSVCVGNSIFLTNSVPSGTWSSSDNGIATVNPNGLVTGVAGGTVTISYSVTNGCGTSTSNAVILIQPCITGIASLSENQDLNIYPNPGRGSVTLDIPRFEGSASILLIDVLGRVIDTRNTVLTTLQLNYEASGIQPGTYKMEIRTRHRIYTKTLVFIK